MDMNNMMDSSSSSSSNNNNNNNNNPNWLVFSLSNQISLFQPASTSSAGADQENGSGTGGASSSEPHHLTALGPKLEDFLGGSSAADGVVAQFDTTGAPHHVDMYDDSELKAIAAGFLRGFSSTDQQLVVAPQPLPKKAAENFGQRTSIFRGVTRHRWTGRYEAHLWDNSCRREGQSRKGRQVYLGGYDKEEKAARAYDLAALKYWGHTTTTNFPVSDYERELEEMKHMTRQEFVASLRRKSSGFSRGASIYRGVTRHHQHGRWQARIGRVAGNKDLYLGTFSTQEEAAEAYDIAAIKFRGLNAVTNFDMSRYDVRSIASSNLPIGGATNKPKTSPESVPENRSGHDVGPAPYQEDIQFSSQNSAASINFGLPIKQDQSSSLWAALGYSQTPSSTTNNAIKRNDINAENRNASAMCTTIFQESQTNATTFQVMDQQIRDQTPNNSNNNNNEALFNGYYQLQQHQGSGTSDHHQDSSDGTSDEAAAVVFGNGGDWIAPSSVHSFQAVKNNNLSAFQTPLIFGIE